MSGNQAALTTNKDTEKTLKERLDWAAETLETILQGGKPAIDVTHSDEKWLYDQLTRLYAGHFLSSPASSYVVLPDDTDETVAAKGDTRFHPVAARFILNQKRKLVDEMASSNIRNYFVMGSDRQIAPDADHFVMVPAGIEALYQTVQCLRENIASDKQKLIIIQNNEETWTPFLQFLRTTDPQTTKSLNCVVTGSREDTKNAVLFAGHDVQKEVEAPAFKKEYANGMEIQFGSTQPKKADETSQIINHENNKAGLRDAVVPLHWFLSADEVSKTFEGNGFEKIDSMMTRIYDQIGYDEVVKRLEQRGYDPERTVFMANDTGLAFNFDFSQEQEFAAAKDEAIPGKHWPDVELGPIVDAMGGITHFMEALHKCAERKGLVDKVAYRDTQLYMFFKLAPRKEDVKVNTYFGTSTGKITFDPRPSNNGSLYTEHFCVPDGQPSGLEPKTQAELGARYLLTESPQARTVRAIMQDFNVPQSLKPLFDISAKQRNHRNRLRLLTQENWLADVPVGRIEKGFTKTANNEGWKTTGRKFDAFEDYAAAGDAIYLGTHSKEIIADYEEHKAALSLLFCKAGTHKQILHDTMYGKALMINNPQLSFFSQNGAMHQNWADPAMGQRFLDYLQALDPAEHPWGQQLLLYRYFHENSLIKQQPKYIWTQVEGKPLTVSLREAKEQFRQHAITHYEKEEFGLDRTDLPSVTLLGSASTRKPLYTHSAYYLGYEFARHGFHVRSGGGRYGIMGAVSQGVMTFQDNYPKLADTCHLSAIQMPRTVQFEGLALDIATIDQHKNRYVSIEPGMDPRMVSLFRSDVMIADAGGLGTLEEIFYFIQLKKMGHPNVKDKPLIIINHPHLGPDAIKLYDPLLATLSAKDKRDIHVVENAQEALDMTLRFVKNGYKPQTPERGVKNSAAGQALTI